MRIAYFGSPQISAILLESLFNDQNHEVVFVVSNADRPQGRSKKPVPTPVSSFALDHQLPLYRYESLKDHAIVDEWAAQGADLFVVFAYGKIIPESLFSLPKFGSINLHASLLPLLRGASPIQSAILEGFTTSGWTIQFIEKKLDAGQIICQKQLPIYSSETAAELTDRMLPAGIELVHSCLDNFENLAAKAVKQDASQATYCTKLRPESAYIDWHLDAQAIHNKIMAFNPSPGARSTLEGNLLKLWRSKVLEGVPSNWQDAIPGSFGAGNEKGDLWVRCGTGILSLLEIQPVGRKKLTARDFLNGYRSEGLVALESVASH